MSNILTKREKEIFDYLAQNKTTAQIAQLINVSDKTVRNHISNVIGKLGVNSRTQALIELIRLNIITIN
ncbi:MAG: LuxR C-terminal-related transcriptional regulator [bacterium]